MPGLKSKYNSTKFYVPATLARAAASSKRKQQKVKKPEKDRIGSPNLQDAIKQIKKNRDAQKKQLKELEN